jgi:hypothetical protein
LEKVQYQLTILSIFGRELIFFRIFSVCKLETKQRVTAVVAAAVPGNSAHDEVISENVRSKRINLCDRSDAVVKANHRIVHRKTSETTFDV